MCTSLGSHPTTFVVRRTPASSSSATIRDHVRRGERRRPRVRVHGEPDHACRGQTPGVGSHARLRQTGQIGTGGWTRVPQSVHRWMRSRPSAPDFQNHSVAGVSSGSGLVGGWRGCGHVGPSVGDDLRQLDARADARRGGAHDGDGVDGSVGGVAGRHCSHLLEGHREAGCARRAERLPPPRGASRCPGAPRTDPGPWCSTRSHGTAASSRPSPHPGHGGPLRRHGARGQGAGGDGDVVGEPSRPRRAPPRNPGAARAPRRRAAGTDRSCRGGGRPAARRGHREPVRSPSPRRAAPESRAARGRRTRRSSGGPAVVGSTSAPAGRPR